MSEAQDLIDEFNMWIERGTMPRMTAANTLILLEEIKRLTADAEKWRNTALQLSNNHGQARNKVDNLEADYIISNRELLILQSELASRDEYISKLEAKIPKLNIDLAEASMHAYNGESARMKLEAELARRDEELALTEKKLCNIDRSARAEVARRDKIIKQQGEVSVIFQEQLSRREEIIRRLKEVGGWMYIAHDEKDIRECEDWCALMKELEND
jgi:chromosome segregation ATPase